MVGPIEVSKTKKTKRDPPIATSDPSPAWMATIRDMVTDEGIACVFSQPQCDTGIVRTVSRKSAAGAAVIDPLG